ncbi:MAG: four helix bundle protein [Planctomycetes bacterium]|nr:four helix bundle protein [Planctomycetota bacterium]
MADAGRQSRSFDLEDRLINFAVRITRVVEALPDTRVSNHVGGQLLRSGTSPAFHYGEVEGAESKDDFIHKMKVCLKELREARIALLIVERRELLPPRKVAGVLAECEELIRIFRSGITTAEQNRARRPASRRSHARET